MKEQKNMPVIFNPDIAHIVYASDDKFAGILGISMVSLYENNKDMENIIVYIMDGGISVSNKKKLTLFLVYITDHFPFGLRQKI